MARYIIDIDGYESEIETSSAEEAAEEAAVAEASWGELNETLWLRVRVRPAHAHARAWEEYKIPVHPTPPPCIDGYEHDWQDPIEVVGGIEEAPGVRGYGGGVIIKRVCSRCGRYRIKNTWGQAPWGEQGMTVIRYADADERSREWVESLEDDDDDDDE
jgi:hypothetical protein